MGAARGRGGLSVGVALDEPDQLAQGGVVDGDVVADSTGYPIDIAVGLFLQQDTLSYLVAQSAYVSARRDLIALEPAGELSLPHIRLMISDNGHSADIPAAAKSALFASCLLMR